MKKLLTVSLLAALGLAGRPTVSPAQVTTSSISGVVADASGNPLTGASVVAVHVPSGTTYRATTRADGRVTIPGMRVGGPYRVTASQIGFESSVQEDVYLNLGVATDLTFSMRELAVELQAVRVTATPDAIFSSRRTGAATSVSRTVMSALPTLARRIEDYARLTPQYSGAGFGYSFAGQDNRFNNTTIDGAYFNNSFGLAGQPGDRTGVAPISLEAIEQLQVNIAPYDVRHGNFVGAGVNTVTRSGTNQFIGSLYYQFRNDGTLWPSGPGFVGHQAGSNPFDAGSFSFSHIGVLLGGPIIQNKLFFFVDYEHDGLTQPGTTFRANLGGGPTDPAWQTPGASITRVPADTLDALSSYLATNFGYATGPYQGYDHETPATRFTAKLDYNVDDRNKVTVRYTHLDSDTDVLVSNSSSLGFGSRRSNTTGLNYRNSNYIILENIRQVVGEWNSIVRGGNMANQLVVGYSHHDESRDYPGEFFPFVDILESGSVLTSFGFEPFTPNNELRYGSFQLQDNFSIYGTKHDWTFGVSAERYESENVFFDGAQSIYVYNSLADFYTDADDYLANPSRTTSPITLNRFQVRWTNIPGQVKPIQPLEVFYAGIYGQDEWQATEALKVTFGVRLDVPAFANTAFANSQVDGMTFRDETGAAVGYSTSKMPDRNLLISPRVGFNWDPRGDRSTQVRGGTGIFTGRPAYVWISNQIGNNGVITGFDQQTNTTARPFHPDPDHYKPTTVTGAPAASYALAFTDPNFRFPQLWRNNLAVDQRLPYGLIATAEFLYNRDVNGIYYINANLIPASWPVRGGSFANARFTGADRRPRWPTTNRLNGNVTSAIVLRNQNEGYSWNVAFSLERPFAAGLWGKLAYSYGETKNIVDPGSIAVGSWTGNAHAGDPNNPGLGFSSNSPGHRVFAALSYRRQFFEWGATTVTLFWEGRTAGSASYVYSGDLNNDGGTANDLIYIPRDASEMNFQQYTSGTETFTVQEQIDAWEAFIQQDEYLSAHRGEYAERGAVFLPMVFRADLSVIQDVFRDIAGNRNSLQIRLDVLNVGNGISSLLGMDTHWGVSQRLVTTSPLVVPTAAQGGPADALGRAQYRLRNIGGQLITNSLEESASLGDVFRILLGVRYNFN